ncbi:amino acid deaminase/aldolase, partial [Streptomyces beijiangensis]|nr:amino acid deaminase/aldolase [Streptomyces beijiangensis]
MTPRAADRTRYDRATAHLDAPLAIVDLEAFDANARDLVRRAAGKPIRVASKSVRCRALLERVLAQDGFEGLMSFTLAESLWLARSGFDDVLLAYPSADRAGYAELAADPKLAQLAELARSIARRPGFRLVGIMAYEGHVAGVGDSIAGRPLRSRAVRLMQSTARKELATRRAAVVRAVRAVAPELEFVNGGGTGSVQHTAAED